MSFFYEEDLCSERCVNLVLSFSLHHFRYLHWEVFISGKVLGLVLRVIGLL